DVGDVDRRLFTQGGDVDRPFLQPYRSGQHRLRHHPFDLHIPGHREIGDLIVVDGVEVVEGGGQVQLGTLQVRHQHGAVDLRPTAAPGHQRVHQDPLLIQDQVAGD